jgi:phage terminase small subunit
MPFLTNPRHEAFAQAYARGATAGLRAASYLAAGYKCDGESAARNGRRLMKDPRVLRRIAEIQRDLDARFESSIFHTR